MAKKALVLDASVITKWFLTETDTDKAIEVRDRFATGKISISIPSLAHYEVINALRYSGVFDENSLLIAGRSLSKYPFEIWSLKGRLLDETIRLSLNENLTVYDAAYVALAKRKGAVLLTEDLEMQERFPSIAKSLSEFRDHF